MTNSRDQFLFSLADLTTWLEEFGEEYSSFFLITDQNTSIFCAPLLQLPSKFTMINIEIGGGENGKSLATCQGIWHSLMENGADRKSLVINLGGGLVTDIGAFAASCYKRGISFFNIPTSLLGMVDAAIGSKTGVNFNGAKNQIGSFSRAEKIVIDPKFLQTLPEIEFKSGMGEILKYALIADKGILQDLHFEPKDIDLSLILRCIDIKEGIVAKDPLENGLRKTLNFGHTIGHALEAYSYMVNKPLLHGIAIAWGMLAESFISSQKIGFKELDLVKSIVHQHFPKPKFAFSKQAINQILGLINHDKKNESTKINCVLLSEIGQSNDLFSLSVEELKNALIWLKLNL